eukprot:COSAG05_NODE_1576_length_4506_cov_7.927687_5_plen_110_part_00
MSVDLVVGESGPRQNETYAARRTLAYSHVEITTLVLELEANGIDSTVLYIHRVCWCVVFEYTYFDESFLLPFLPPSCIPPLSPLPASLFFSDLEPSPCVYLLRPISKCL